MRSLVTSMLGRVAACIALGGCSGSATTEPTRPEETTAAASTADTADENAAKIVCEAFCSRAEACGRSDDCDCPARGRKLGLLKRSYLGTLALCLDGVACSAVEADRAWQGCHDFVLNGIDTTPSLRRFCFEASRRAARCGRADEADQSACLVSYRHITDEALDNAVACLAGACAEVPGCFARWLQP